MDSFLRLFRSKPPVNKKQVPPLMAESDTESDSSSEDSVSSIQSQSSGIYVTNNSEDDLYRATLLSVLSEHTEADSEHEKGKKVTTLEANSNSNSNLNSIRGSNYEADVSTIDMVQVMKGFRKQATNSINVYDSKAEKKELKSKINSIRKAKGEHVEEGTINERRLLSMAQNLIFKHEKKKEKQLKDGVLPTTTNIEQTTKRRKKYVHDNLWSKEADI